MQSQICAFLQLEENEKKTHDAIYASEKMYYIYAFASISLHFPRH